MAERRMFSRQIIESDSFTDMPDSARLLYFHLALRADDDGFISSAKSILRMAGVSEADIKSLTDADFLLPLDDGVYLIRHWHAHNNIPRSVYTPSRYAHLLENFKVDGQGRYVSCERAECESTPTAEDTQDEDDDIVFELKIVEYFIRAKYFSSPDSFIAYNKSRGWRGVGGENVKENYERYIDEWEKSYCIKHSLPLPYREM